MSGLSVWGDTVDSLNGLGEDAVSEAPVKQVVGRVEMTCDSSDFSETGGSVDGLQE